MRLPLGITIFFTFIFSISAKAQRSAMDTLTIAGVGDIMIGTVYPEGYLNSHPFQSFDGVKDYLQNNDLTFGNMEGALSDTATSVKECSNPKLCYAFRMPEVYASLFSEVGFDVMSLANNHIGDFGKLAEQRSVSTLEKHGIACAGLFAKPYAIFEKDSVRYGFIAVSPNNGTISINNHAYAEKLVKNIAPYVDIMIVSFHGGAEGAKNRHMPSETEYFYGENRGNVYEFSHKMIDAGADIVFGHGPHITRCIEIYKDRFIAYSLGNFATYARFNLRGVNGIAPIAKIKTRLDGKFIEGEIISIKQIGEGIPILDNNQGAFKEIIELTNEDLPDHNIEFDLEGGKFWQKAEEVE